MNISHYKSQRWWQVPLLRAQSGKSTWKYALLLFMVSLLMPQRGMAQSDYKSWYPFKDDLTYYPNGGNPYFLWSTVLWNDEGDDEGFFEGDGYAWGIGVHIGVGDQAPSQYKYVGNLCCNSSGLNRRMYNVYNKKTWDSTSWITLDGWELGGQWTFRYNEGTDGKGKIRWISPHWNIPFELRNTNIKVRLWGTWWYWNKSSKTVVDVTHTIACPYTFTVRQIQWNDNYINISPDGTVTIPYKFSGSGNTDGRTGVYTRINGTYNSKCGYFNPSTTNFAAGTYSFKLSSLGYNMRSQFTIEPYHEFPHANDRDNNNQMKWYNTLAGAKTFAPMPVATIKSVVFNQGEKKVTVNWTADNGNFETGNWGTKWVIYRNGTKIGAVEQSARSFVDTGYTNETEATYQIYYVWKGWPEDTKLDELKSNIYTFTPTRTVPVNNLKAESQTDRIAFTWTSDGYPTNWGNKFNIYIDNEADPVYTITPTNNQTSFQWEHRTTAAHTDRKNGVTNGIHWTEEPLNACQPHDYRIEGVIDEKVLNTASLEKKGIGTGTLFYSFEATKGSYAGQVKLAWHVNLQGSTDTKNYIIERRRAEKESEAWTKLQNTMSAEEYVYYNDDTPLPGVYYDYRITVEDKCPDGTILHNSIEDIGFAQSTGTVSGRITYGSSGASVAGAEVFAQKTGESSNDAAQYHAMHFTALNGAVAWQYPDANYAKNKFQTGDYSMQMWINPEEFPNSWIGRLKGDNIGAFGLTGSGELIYCCGSAPQYNFNIHVKQGVYNHVTLTRKGNVVTYYLVEQDSLGNPVVQKASKTIHAINDLKNATQFTMGYFKGYIDEFRIWSKCLTEEEILENYDHLLVGNEKNLETYWTFDEGLKTQFFDYSRDGTVYNQHHGKIGSNVESVTLTPEELKLKAKTDNDGNYIIQGVPFTGEGTTYAIVPKLGIHKFNPTQRLRFVSANSLVHNGTDFDDISSFTVSGKVVYAGTDYPVEGVNFYVDGTACSRGGELISTNADGEYTISVPIGDHYIKAVKNGHVFANAGRFPADPLGIDTLATFIEDKKDLEFQDETLVNFTGRVVGGDIQGKPAVGFGLSKNNIGTVELLLTPLNKTPRMNVVKNLNAAGTAYSVDPNSDTLPIPSATTTINSTSWRGAGINDCKKLFIHTDTVTGEFSAMLPPLEYKIESMTIVGTKEEIGSPSTIDLTNPNYILSDTLYNDDGETYELYEYNTKLNYVHHTDATFNVKQKGRKDGSFGIDSYKLTDDLGDLNITDIYTAANNTVTYNYGAPIFIQGDPYTFQLEGYEKYVNADTNVPDTVPLIGNIVTISNALSSQQSVYYEQVGTHQPGEVANLKDNKLQLDSLGRAMYLWKAGLPNIANPYTRTISISYDINGTPKNWKWNDRESMPGIILGSLPTGNNFITAGPDKVNMVLRDPPGTNSFAEWKSGTTTTRSTLSGTTFHESAQLSFKHKFGFHKAIGIGVGVIDMEEVEAGNDLEIGVKTEYDNESSTTVVSTTTVEKTISTSAAPEYVGAQGDVYIGNSTNILFGKMRNLDFKRNSDNSVGIELQDIIQTGIDFGTMFMYTQNYIENVLIPNYELLRKKFLTTTVQDSINSYVNKTDHTVYLTTLSPDDDDYGTENTYKVFKAANVSIATDSVAWVNNQIENWTNRLKDNEEEKVKAFESRDKYLAGDNLSFDSGTIYSFEETVQNDTTTTRDWTISGGLVLDDSWGLAINGFGFNIHIQDETFGGEHHVSDSTYSSTNTFSYTLAEDGDDDALSVDVFNYGTFGPIFRTRAGQTCCPYEGKVETKYYNPGTTIMEATMQIEVPQIDADDRVLNDIPSGGTANYTLRLSNASEIDEDVYYRLFVDDESNPDGADLTIDGRHVTDSRIIKIPAGQTVTKALQLKQTNASILDYDSIAVVLASQCQYDPTSTWDVITDTVYISAHFVPSSSDVKLELSNTVINTQTGTNLKLTFSDFDRNYHNLKAFRIQYKEQGATSWTPLKEYVINKKDSTSNNLMLPSKGASVSYTLNMNSFNDGDYLFRVVSVATYGDNEVYKYSNEIALVKDMMCPRPMGQPEPTDGILDIGDELSVTFNEPFLKGELTKAANFIVTGVLNGTEIEHETALSVNSGTTAVAAAATEASINLAKKDFSIDAWVNINGTGTLLSHGQGNNTLTIGTNSAGNLVVKVAGNEYTSTEIVPTNKWSFLSLCLTADGKLSAKMANDANEISFFNEKPVATYEGNGPLSVGGGNAAAIHELLLWDEAHDMTTALANRSKTKNPSTRHLIGYWKMDEGEGTSIRDYARSRNMTMPNETWYLNNENKSVSLDGNHYVDIYAAELPITDYDDYAVEFWMRGDQQSGETQLMQMGEVALSVNADGQLLLTGKGAYLPTPQPDSQFSALNSQLTDNTWHHIALNVLRQGAAAVYVDGKRCLTTNAANVGSIATGNMIVGAHRTTVMADDVAYTYDRAFNGEIDEIRVWAATMNADMLSKNRKVRFTGKEPGLVAYYPFETKAINTSTNQIETVGTANDLTDSGKSAQFKVLGGSSAEMAYTNEAPALRSKPIETNVSFNYTASNEKIVIDIDEDPAVIEGCTLNFTVRYLRDENGNYSEPAVWSAFVNRKELEWKEESVSCVTHATEGTSMTATIVNKSGTQQMWTLEGMPSWLEASTEYGSTNPLEETKVTFTVSKSTPIGKYEETVYLKGNNGIETPLTINVKVTGETPTWAVDPGEYEQTMNVIGNLVVIDTPSEDSEDIVAAFIDGECRGVAQPQYLKRFDRYFVTIDIYGRAQEKKDGVVVVEGDEDKTVEFKVYDASTGIIYPVVNTSIPVTFADNSLVGLYTNPDVLTATDEIEQSIDLGKGWNWMSLSVSPNDFTVPVVFAKANGKVSNVKSQFNGYKNFANGTWSGKLNAMNSNQMYAVKTTEAFTLTVTGHRVVTTDVPVTVGKGWNWVGYNASSLMSVTEALAGMDPQDGDIIKAQRGISYYDNHEWLGSLQTMMPGKGYKIFSTDTNDRQFSYPASGAALSRVAKVAKVSEPAFFTPVDYSDYSTNMVLIAQVLCGEPLAGVELGVFAGDECREAAVTDEQGMVYITIPGDDSTTLTFNVATGEKVVTAPQTIVYEADAVYGTPRVPFIIDLGATTGIGKIENGRLNNNHSVYDLQGRRVDETQLKKGVYIVNGQKKVK
ncbi:MAG: hypothetical protein IKZ48_00890 [Prevotella sp.]|nr:hypothetical protein [Prevotella sp.]